MLNSRHFDADDYFWVPTDPPYKVQRKAGLRLEMLMADLVPHRDFALSGSVMRWGAPLEDIFSHIVFLTLDAKVRVARLQHREVAKFGRADPEFLEWAAQYDEGRLPGRSRKLHEEWLAARQCPVLRIEGDLTVEQRVSRVLSSLHGGVGIAS